MKTFREYLEAAERSEEEKEMWEHISGYAHNFFSPRTQKWSKEDWQKEEDIMDLVNDAFEDIMDQFGEALVEKNETKIRNELEAQITELEDEALKKR